MAIAVFFAEGFEEIEALTVVDLTRRAGIETKMISVTGERRVTGSHGIEVTMDGVLEETDFQQLEMLVLPGGMPGTLNLKACEPLMEQIRAFEEQGKYIAAICAAPTVFGALGLLKERKACCYPGMEEQLQAAKVAEDACVVSDKVITSRGMGTAMDFGLKIVEILKSNKEARDLSRAVVYK